MGIQNLHKFFKPASKKLVLDSSWKGKKVGVDAMCWMHRGAVSCAYDLIVGIETDRFIKFFLGKLQHFEDEKM